MILHPANFLYWALIVIGIIFFSLIIFSSDGEEDLEIDSDTNFGGSDGSRFKVNSDLEVEIDTDADLEIDGEKGFNPWRLLSWIGLGKAPLMILLGIDFSSWGMAGWILNTIIQSITGKIPDQFWGLGGVVLITSFLIGILIGSLLSHPIAHLFASFGEDVSSERLIGCIGTVSSKKLPYLTEGKIGQVNVYDTAGNLVSIGVALPHWATVIPHRGYPVLIIEQHQRGYLAIAKESSDEDKWMNSHQ